MHIPDDYRLPDLSDPEIFKVYFDLYVHEIYNFVFRKVKDRDTADDITECIFITLVEKVGGIKTLQHFEGFLYTTARNLIYKYHQKEELRFQREQEIAYILYRVKEQSSAAEEAEQIENQLLALEKGIKKLPPRKREILILFRKGMKVPAIAELMGISPQTVRNHIAQAIIMLRDDIIGHRGGNNPSFS